MLNLFKKKTKFGAIKSMLVDHLSELEQKKDSIPEDVFDVTKFTLQEILGVFESMDILMQKNDFDGCIKLSRSILENSINLQYIYKEDTEKRAKNFKLSSLKGMARKFEALDEYTPEAKEMYEFFQKELKDHEPEKNVRDKFKAVNSDATYLRSYRRLSEFVHPVYRHEKIDFTENRPFVMELKRTVRSDTSLVTLMVLEKVCTKYDLDGGVMSIDDPGYKGIVFFATNPKRQEEEKKRK
jgi:hypothetical protein